MNVRIWWMLPLLFLSSCETIDRSSPSAQNDTTFPVIHASLANGHLLQTNYLSGGPVSGWLRTEPGTVPIRTQEFQVAINPDTQVQLVFSAEDPESGIASMDWQATVGFRCIRGNSQDWLTLSKESSFRAPNPDQAPREATLGTIRFSKLAAWTEANCETQPGNEHTLHFEVNFSFRARNNSPRGESAELSGTFRDMGIIPRR
jgi:hypothetical protein